MNLNLQITKNLAVLFGGKGKTTLFSLFINKESCVYVFICF